MRLTFVDTEQGRAELNQMMERLDEDFNILNKSRVYKGRGGSKFSNIYSDVDTDLE